MLDFPTVHFMFSDRSWYHIQDFKEILDESSSFAGACLSQSWQDFGNPDFLDMKNNIVRRRSHMFGIC